MAPQEQPDADARDIERQRGWLLQFLLTLSIASAGFAVLEVALAVALRHPPLLVTAGATLLVFVTSWVGRRWVHRGQLKPAARLNGYAVLLAGAISAPLSPYGTACLALVP